MGKTETFSDPFAVLKGQFNFGVVDSDGEIDCGRCYNFQPATNAPRVESLMEVHNEREVTVRTDLLGEEFTFSYALRGLTPAGRIRLVSGGEAPTIDQAYRLLRHVKQGQLLRNARDSGLPKEYKLQVTGLPQAHNSTLFPVATSITAADDATVGTFGADDYYVWIVPVYRDLDAKHGPADADFVLSNWANLVRGEHYVYGTPAQFDDSGTAVAITLNHSIAITFDEPSISSGVATPTHFAVVIGTADDIEDGSSYVAALDAWSGGSHAIKISAAGTVAFGDTPALADLALVETGGTSSDVRVYSAEVEDTDYTVDRVNDAIKRVEGGDISDGEPVRINVWYLANPTQVDKQGGQGSAERYEWLRFSNLRADGTDPDSRHVEGVIVDFPRVNTAAMGSQLVSAAKDGFHDPIPFSSVKAEIDPTLGYACKVTQYGPANAQNVDMYSDDITPQNG